MWYFAAIANRHCFRTGLGQWTTLLKDTEESLTLCLPTKCKQGKAMMLKNLYIPYLFPRLPEALILAREQLADAERDLLVHAHAREYHVAMEAMCRDRVVRLTEDVQSLEWNHTNGGQPIEFNQKVIE